MAPDVNVKTLFSALMSELADEAGMMHTFDIPLYRLSAIPDDFLYIW